jgi:hypothetical protein
MDHKCSKMLSCVFRGIVVAVGVEVITGEGVWIGEMAGSTGETKMTGVIVEAWMEEGFSSMWLASIVCVGCGVCDGKSVRQAMRRKITGSRTSERIFKFIYKIKLGLSWFFLCPVLVLNFHAT